MLCLAAGSSAEIKCYKSLRKNSSETDLFKLKETQSVVNNMINDILSDEDDGIKIQESTYKQINSDHAFVPFEK